jgi:hypothetical protein
MSRSGWRHAVTTGPPEIFDEMLGALRKNRLDISDEKASILRERMNAAVRDCLVLGCGP